MIFRCFQNCTRSSFVGEIAQFPHYEFLILRAPKLQVALRQVLSSFPVKYCVLVLSYMCNYICCPEIENLANGDFHSNPGNITAKLSLLLVMKSKSRYISKKSLKSCSNFSRRI